MAMQNADVCYDDFPIEKHPLGSGISQPRFIVLLLMFGQKTP